ncbi:Putative ribonuclease H protein At1g65750 [Linum perenne]
MDFSSNVGSCSITHAELRGVAIGLKLAWEAGARKVVVQADSRAAIALLLRNWEVVFHHTYREGNRTADFLANLGHSLPFGTHSIPVSDCNLCFYLRLNCMGISEPGSIIVST